MDALNFHRDQSALEGLSMVGPAWASNGVMGQMTPTTGSMQEYDQRAAAYSFAAQAGSLMSPTWRPTPAAGVMSTPKSNMAVHVHYLVNQAMRRRNDIFPEELVFVVNDTLARPGRRAPVHMVGLHEVARWLHDESCQESQALGFQRTPTLIMQRFSFIGSLLTNPWPVTANGVEKPSTQETYVGGGRARLQDIWSYQSTSTTEGRLQQERLSVVFTRRDKPRPRIHHNPRYNKVLIDRQFQWTVMPVSHDTDEPLWHLWNSDHDVNPVTGEEIPGGRFRGLAIEVGVFWRDLTMQQHGPKPFFELARDYLHSNDAMTQFGAYKQLRSVEVMIRQP